MKKLMILLTFFGIVLTFQKSVKAADDKIIISQTQNAILANVGDVIDLDDYKYQHNQTTFLDFNQVTLTAFSEGISIASGEITVLAKGQHAFLLQYESANIYVYVLSKAVVDTEYILFESGFDDVPNGKLPNGFQTLSGSSGIQEEQLLVAGKGGGAMVALPNYLRSFVNYIIEVDMTIVEADNDSRWASVMFRYQPSNYYQMAIRKDATLSNGVEFAKQISGSWNVTNTASFTESLSPAKMYSLKIDVLDSTIKEYMDGTLLITHEQALEYKRGLIGVQASGANALFDNFKVTLPVSYLRTESFEFQQIPTVYEPITQIVNPATVMAPFKSMADLVLYQNKRPSTLILSVNGDLDVVNDQNQKLDSLYNILVAMNGKMIPAIKTTDVDVAKQVAEKLRLWGILDVYVVSSDANVIIESRKIHEMIRGVLDLSERTFVTTQDLDQIRKDTNSSQSVAVILNSASVNKKAVNYLQHRLVTVMTTALENTDEARLNALLSGVNGIITNNPLELFDLYETFTETTHVREVFLIAHRGLHNGYSESSGPENSIEVLRKVIEHGARITETDIHLTLDNGVVIMHDATTNRTANQNFAVAQQPLGALEGLLLNDISNTGKTFNVPSFSDYIEVLRGTEVVLFLEIKPTNKLLLEKARDIIIEKNMENQVVFIAFGAQNVTDMKTVMPTMANGYLTGSLLNSGSVPQSMLNVLTSIVPMKSTLNPSFGQLTPEFVKALTHRGITVWPWTIDDANSMNYYHTAGVGGVTTNSFDYMKDAFLELSFEQSAFEHTIGKPLTISGQLKSLSGLTYPFRSDLIILRNDANATFDQSGKLISVDKKGEVVFYTKAQSTLPNGQSIELYSDLMSVTFVDKANLWSNPWLYIASSAGIMALAAGIWFTLKKGK